MRAPLAESICVQGAPGTGKTAVGLHRAAYLLYTHGGQLARTGVLVVGPNRAFLRYIEQVLPTLGEVDVDQTTVADLTARVPVRAVGPARGRRPQGRRADGRGAAPGAVGRDRQARRLDPGAAGRPAVPGARSSGSSATSTTCAAGPAPTTTSSCCTTRPAGSGWRCWSPRTRGGRRRRPAAARRTPRPGGPPAAPRCARSATRSGPRATPPGCSATSGRDPARLARAARGVLDDDEQALLRWPGPRSVRTAPWTPADAVLVDEVAGLLERTPGYGHVVVDEAQDLSPMQCRAVARRLAAGSLTVLGDLAQATSPWSPSDWQETLAGLGPAGHRRAPAHPRLPRAAARSSTSPTGCCRSSRPGLPAATAVRSEPGSLPVRPVAALAGAAGRRGRRAERRARLDRGRLRRRRGRGRGRGC